ncbi:acetyltransferase [Botryobacter ruber]|uniref:acetyltransferase n=1 Tax=Botryobacter ruber TaxID=2171629 RepID=UPI000E0B0A56|nr:acetyltransferase [Botryobacter ruber]
MKNIAIVGAGGLGREVLVLLHQINDVAPQWNILGFYDDDTSLSGTHINGLPWLGNIPDLADAKEELSVVIAIGLPKIKQQLAERLQQNPLLSFPALVHPLAQPKPYQFVQLAEGVVVFQGAVLTTNIRLGKHALVYLNCTVGHDTTLGAYVSLMPGVNLAGNTILEEGVFVGANAAILQGLHIGNHSHIGAGAVVTTAIPHNCTAAGVPAKIIKSHEL